MTIRQPRYTPEEHARRGQEMYEQKIRAAVEAGNDGKIIAIDVDSGAFEVAKTMLEACDRLLLTYPDAQIWCVRIGHDAVHRFGRVPQVKTP